MAKILVTGGCGFIGSHTSLLLLEKGYELIILDSNINSSSEVIKKILHILKTKNIDGSSKLNFYKGDVRDKIILEKIFLDAIKIGKKIDGVIHFSGLKSVKESTINPLEYWDVNVFGSICLIEIMNKYDCKKLIFSSTASIYGDSGQIPFKEDSIPKPLNPYTNTKLTVERFLKDLSDYEKENWNILSLRYFNPIGAHHSGMLGEEPKGIPNNIFPILLNSLAKKKQIYIFGNDWPTLDGTCVRDYIHIEDLADGHIAALEAIISKKIGYLNINLGTGKGTSVLELIKTFEKVNGVKVKYKYSNRRVGDCPILIADNSLAIKTLQWIPKRDLESICKDGFNWFKCNRKSCSK